MSEKKRFPLEQAEEIGRELVDLLRPWCEIVEIAGSIRRRKKTVGDIEIVYVPRFVLAADGFFDSKKTSAADIALARLEQSGIIARREHEEGGVMSWGEKNKLAVHLASGIPVDFFATAGDCWPNYLLCRTGGALNNTRIAMAAKSRGLKWHPYGKGFEVLKTGTMFPVKSEADVYRLAGLPYLPPEKRP